MKLLQVFLFQVHFRLINGKEKKVRTTQTMPPIKAINVNKVPMPSTIEAKYINQTRLI